MSFFQDPPLHDFPDRAIRRLLANPSNLRELVEQVDPILAGLLDFSRTEVVERSFLLDDWRRRESDILCEIPLLDPEGGAPVLICVLVEHQSQEDAWMPLRLLVYAALYWERKWKNWEESPRPRAAPSLPPIVPIVFHTGDRPWNVGRRLADLLQGPECVQGYAPEWRTLFWDLAERSPQELASAAGAWLRALAVVAAKRESPDEFRGTYVRVLKQLDELVGREQVRRDDLLWFLLSWVLQRRPDGEGYALLELAQAVQTTEAQRRKVEFMSQTIERTWADARFAEGKVEGKVEAILRTLRVRFGSVPPEISTIVAGIQSDERLDALQDAAVVCRGMAEFRGWLTP